MYAVSTAPLRAQKPRAFSWIQRPYAPPLELEDDEELEELELDELEEDDELELEDAPLTPGNIPPPHAVSAEPTAPKIAKRMASVLTLLNLVTDIAINSQENIVVV